MHKVNISVVVVIFLFSFMVYAGKEVSFINQATCARCGTCQKVCQMKASSKIEKDGKISFIVDPKKCIGCGACVNVCPTKSTKLISAPSVTEKEQSNTSTDTSKYALKTSPKIPSNETRQPTSAKKAN